MKIKENLQDSSTMHMIQKIQILQLQDSADEEQQYSADKEHQYSADEEHQYSADEDQGPSVYELAYSVQLPTGESRLVKPMCHLKQITRTPTKTN